MSTPSDIHEVGDKFVLSWPKRLHNRIKCTPTYQPPQSGCVGSAFQARSGFARQHLHGFCGKGNITSIKRYANQIQPPDVHNILHSPCVLDPEVPERAKMAFEMKDRLDQLRRSSVRVIVRAGIAIITSYRKPLIFCIAHRHKATAQKQINCPALSVSYALYWIYLVQHVALHTVGRSFFWYIGV